MSHFYENRLLQESTVCSFVASSPKPELSRLLIKSNQMSRDESVSLLKLARSFFGVAKVNPSYGSIFLLLLQVVKLSPIIQVLKQRFDFSPFNKYGVF